MIGEIEQWLEGQRDYAAGVAIVRKYSKSAFLKRMLATGETDFNREKMLAEILQLSQQRKAPEAPHRPAMEILTDGEYQKAPPEVKALKNKATELNKLNGRRHAQLMTWVAEARRSHPRDIARINAYLRTRSAGDVANQILDTDDELADLYFKIDYWRIHGKLPAGTPEHSLPLEDKYHLQKQLNNVRSRISKLKTRPEKEAQLKEAIAFKERLEAALEKLA